MMSSASSIEDVIANEIKLFYVAVTRSKYALYMTYSNTLSRFFPKSSDNYEYSEI